MEITPSTIDSGIWDNEYKSARIIPSSLRDLPSKAFVQLASLIDFQQYRHVLDAGCGNGRNAVYLAQFGCRIDAVDFSSEAISLAKERIASAGCEANIRLIQDSLSCNWPFRDEQYDFVVDSYVSCHLLSDEHREHYFDELCRVTRKGGLVFSSVFCTDDEYYAERAKGRQVVFDVGNNVGKYLFSEAEFRSFCSKHLSVKFLTKFQFIDHVGGKPYLRSILAIIGSKEA